MGAQTTYSSGSGAVHPWGHLASEVSPDLRKLTLQECMKHEGNQTQEEFALYGLLAMHT